MSSKKSAIIIGGGFAGLAAAVFLDALGLQVTLLEKKSILGGRAYAFQDKKTGYWVDNGQHLLMGAYHETLKLIENIGATRHLFYQPKTHVPLISDKNIHTSFTLPSLPKPLNLLVGLLRMKNFTLLDKLKFLKLGMELHRLKKNQNSNNLDRSVDDWLSLLGQSENTRKNFWDLLTLACLNDDPNVAGAKMLAVVLVKGFLGAKEDARMILPKGNLNEILAEPAMKYLKMRGQEIKLKTGVKKIHILDGAVQSLELSDGEMCKADYYLSAVPFATLLNLVPDGFIESEPYFRNLKNLKTSPILSLNLWFDRDIIPYDFVGVAGRKIHWYFNKNRIYDITHPPYHYMGVTSGAYSLIDHSKEDILELALTELYELFPQAKSAKLLHSLVNKERHATLSPQVGSEKFRPKQKSPFDNMYVIGDWTDTGYPATIESAVVSARMAVDDLQKQFELKL